MIIKLDGGVSITIPTAKVIGLLRKEGYEVKDTQLNRGDVGRGSMGQKLFAITFYDGQVLTLYQALVQLIPDLLNDMAGSDDTDLIANAHKHRFTSSNLLDYILENNHTAILAHLNGPVMVGRMMTKMSEASPLVGIRKISAKCYYVWMPYDTKWVAEGGKPLGLRTDEVSKAQVAAFNKEEYLPPGHPTEKEIKDSLKPKPRPKVGRPPKPTIIKDIYNAETREE